eukprot:244057_1
MGNCRLYIVIFFVYSIFNIGRYLLLGVFTADVNQRNAHDMVLYQQYACDCYFISKKPQNYGIKTDVRFDLAHSVPKCTSCTWCENAFEGSANKSFDTVGTCPSNVEGNIYVDTVGWFSFGSLSHWNDVTGCARKISLSAMIFWIKDYNVYKRWALAVSILYCILLFVLVMVAAILWFKIPIFNPVDERRGLLTAKEAVEENYKAFVNKIDYVSRVIYLYNVLISEVLLYLLYKPLQYYDKNIQVGNNRSVICEISSMPEKSEDWLGMIAFASFIAITCQVVYTVLYSFGCIYKCVKVKCVCCNINLGCFCKCNKSNGSWICC